MSQTPLNRDLSAGQAVAFGTFFCRTCGEDRPIAGRLMRKGKPPVCAFCQAKTKARVVAPLDPAAPLRRRPKFNG